MNPQTASARPAPAPASGRVVGWSLGPSYGDYHRMQGLRSTGWANGASPAETPIS